LVLEVLTGLVAGPKLNDGLVSDERKRILTSDIWPENWGLYISLSSKSKVLATEFGVETLVNPNTNKTCAAKFRVTGVDFNLLVGRPDHPSAWGIFHPQGLIFRREHDEKRIQLRWANTGGALSFLPGSGPAESAPMARLVRVALRAPKGPKEQGFSRVAD
jgi:hypothetical protein